MGNLWCATKQLTEGVRLRDSGTCACDIHNFEQETKIPIADVFFFIFFSGDAPSPDAMVCLIFALSLFAFCSRSVHKLITAISGTKCFGKERSGEKISERFS